MIILPSSKGIISKRPAIILPEVALGYTPQYIFNPSGAKDINGNSIIHDDIDVYSIQSTASVYNSSANFSNWTGVSGNKPKYKKKVSTLNNRPAIYFDGSGGYKEFIGALNANGSRNYPILAQACFAIASYPTSYKTIMTFTLAGSVIYVNVDGSNIYVTSTYGGWTFKTNYSLNMPYAITFYRTSAFSYTVNVIRWDGVYWGPTTSSIRIAYTTTYNPIITFYNQWPYYLCEIILFWTTASTLSSSYGSSGISYFLNKYNLNT